MARKVYRYGPLEIKDGPQEVHLPVNATVVHVGKKHDGYIDIWALADDEATVMVTKLFQVYRTGEPIAEDAQYVDTSIQDYPNGAGVWHVFERMAID